MIQDLIKLSQSVANDVAAIQGAGGNTSVKDNNILYVKASGTLLSEISETKGWAKLNLQQWLNDFSNFTYTNEDDFVAINTNNTIDGGRASIETGLHALLPHKYVLHTHSVYANIFLCSGETQKLINYISSQMDVQVIIVPMCAPGMQLTKHLAEQLQETHKEKPTIVLLKNHGIAVSCNDLNETIRLHDMLHNGVREHFGLPLLKLEELSYLNKLGGSDGEHLYMVFHKPTMENLIDKPAVFFPDQVVYINQQIKYVTEENRVTFNSLTRQQAQNTAEILASVLYLYENIQNPSLLPNDLCEYIANMSGEKYRQGLGQ